MLVKICFIFTLLVWFLDILQPGYLKFYNLNNVTSKIKFQISTAVISKPTLTPTDSICNSPKNNFEKLLSSTNSSCRDANKAGN
ncbi:hypothetical protein CK510_25430 [Brunnivagina elsteri CCALA 953]|uniref:Uncharacterized protein n=1 Tax=Brunnivagina elsteri CCALA 953 TaxID=987040 RepID=A0A2A2TBZ9_9CYAN|nr:hypothetical protein CK510_25430 [Calothrix elsteri CCALA 953]